MIALSIYECFIKGLVGCINTIHSKSSFSAKCIKAGSFNILSVDNSKGLSITLAPKDKAIFLISIFSVDTHVSFTLDFLLASIA